MVLVFNKEKQMKRLLFAFLAMVLIVSPLIAKSESFLQHFASGLSDLRKDFSSKVFENPSSAGYSQTLIGSPSKLNINTYCNEKYYNEIGPIFMNTRLENKTTTVCQQAYTVMYSGVTRTPLWSAEHLTKENVLSGSRLKREDNFHAEDDIPASERAELNDFIRSGCDRGHMSPNKDMPDRNSANQSFSLTNMIPQNPNNNQILWEGIEKATRELAKQYGEVYVITGPLFIGAEIKSLHGRVLIPTNLFKAIYIPSNGTLAAYYTKNKAGMDYDVITILKLEEMTGINLFPGFRSSQKSVKHDLPVPHPNGHFSGKSRSGNACD